MKTLTHLRRNAIAYVALVAAIGTGGAYASEKLTSQQIAKNAVKAKHIKDGQITTADVRDGSLLARDFADGQATHGETGPQGPAGAEGEAATRLWAVVNPGGELAQGRGVTESHSNADSNFYSVRFDRDVSECAMVASVGGNPAYNFAAQGIATVNTLPLGANTQGLVQISTFTLKGEAAQRPFHVAALC